MEYCACSANEYILTHGEHHRGEQHDGREKLLPYMLRSPLPIADGGSHRTKLGTLVPLDGKHTIVKDSACRPLDGVNVLAYPVVLS
jgi:hypothetical protein